MAQSRFSHRHAPLNLHLLPEREAAAGRKSPHLLRLPKELNSEALLQL